VQNKILMLRQNKSPAQQPKKRQDISFFLQYIT